MENFTHLGRAPDFRLFSNIVGFGSLIVASILATLLLLADGQDTTNAAVEGLFAGATVFMAWVLAREIDPDHPNSAVLALPIAFAVYLLVGISALFVGAVTILMARVINRSVGPAPKFTDVVALIGALGLAIFLHEIWLIGVMVFAAFLIESFLPNADPNAIGYALAAAAITLFAALFIDVFTINWAFDAVAVGVMMVAGVLYIIGLFRQPHYLLAVADATKEHLTWSRVATGEWMVLVTGIAIFLVEGSAGIAAFGFAWAAMAAMGLYAIYEQITNVPIPDPPKRTTRRVIEK